MKTAVEQKVAGQEVTIAPEQPTAQIIDLFEALKRSISDASGAANDAASKARGAAGEDAGEAKPPKKAVPRKTARGAKPATG